MNCSPALLEAYLDEELDAAQRAAIEQHLAECAECAAVWRKLESQKAAIRTAPYYHAPSELRRSIRAALQAEAAAIERPHGTYWRMAAIAASLLLVASLAWNILATKPRAPANDLADAALSAHIRSLMGDRPMDVVSTDQHTVKPWFAGKLDFSPEVKDLAAQGFPLAGGRVDYLAHRRVAALVYRRRQHIINLFLWPDASAGADSASSHDGYNVVHWTSGGMTWWAVSDVSLAELERFRSLLR